MSLPVPVNTNAPAVPVYLVDSSTGNAGSSGSSSSTLPSGTNRGGTITAGGTAQQLAPANASRVFLKGQNLSTADLWINEVGGTASASQPSYRIPAGATFSINTNQAVSVFGATTGQAWAATEA